MKKLFIGLVGLLFATTTFAQDEMLSDAAITVQCEIYGSAAASAYVTVLTNVGTDIDAEELGIQLLQMMMSTDMYDHETKLFKNLIPAVNVASFVIQGVSRGLLLVSMDEFVDDMIARTPVVYEQGHIINKASQESCQAALLEHREKDHGGKDPYQPKEDNT